MKKNYILRKEGIRKFYISDKQYLLFTCANFFEIMLEKVVPNLYNCLAGFIAGRIYDTIRSD